MKINKIPFIPCACGCSMIGMEIEDGQVYLAHWSRGNDSDGRTPFKDKLRHIKKILHDGHPYCDEVILDKENLDIFIQELQKIRKLL